MISHLLNIVYGIVFGVANVIPGVSGGTMMVVFGVYDKVHLQRDFYVCIQLLDRNRVPKPLEPAGKSAMYQSLDDALDEIR